MKTEMGSYLLRNSRDESLLVGDLHLTLHGITGLESASDFFICVEVDSYGHYFRKAKTKLVCRSANPVWNESFIVELEGSQNVRILLYEDHSGRQILRAKHVIQVSVLCGYAWRSELILTFSSIQHSSWAESGWRRAYSACPLNCPTHWLWVRRFVLCRVRCLYAVCQHLNRVHSLGPKCNKF